MVINLTLNVRYRCFRRSLICVQNIMLLLGSCTVNNLRFLRLGYTNHIYSTYEYIYMSVYKYIYIYIWIYMLFACTYEKLVMHLVTLCWAFPVVCLVLWMDLFALVIDNILWIRWMIRVTWSLRHSQKKNECNLYA